MEIERLDHLVLTVADIDTTADFYQRVLGMELIVFGDARKALRFGQQKINLHQQNQEYLPGAINATPGSADLCFICSIPLEQVMVELKEKGIELCEGPVTRTGAVGSIESIYIRDPDSNLIEISNY